LRGFFKTVIGPGIKGSFLASKCLVRLRRPRNNSLARTNPDIQAFLHPPVGRKVMRIDIFVVKLPVLSF